VTASANQREKTPQKVVSTIKGEYEIRRGGEPVGTESFEHVVYDDNTVVLSSTYQVVTPESVRISGRNRLVLDEDSRFPREYESRRIMLQEGEERVQEVSARMYANVVDMTHRVGGDVETKRRVLPTGCLFLEGNIAHHLVAILHRYDSSLGGKQVFRTFDPLTAKESPSGLEFAGQGVAGQAEPLNAGPVTLYKFYAGNLPAIDVAVGNDGRVMSVLVSFQDVEYVLTSYSDSGADSGGG
jgi:hypothetical protein